METFAPPLTPPKKFPLYHIPSCPCHDLPSLRNPNFPGIFGDLGYCKFIGQFLSNHAKIERFGPPNVPPLPHHGPPQRAETSWKIPRGNLPPPSTPPTNHASSWLTGSAPLMNEHRTTMALMQSGTTCLEAKVTANRGKK